ncbi:uncharacterized protein LOC110459240 isoform X2 [Mizuhopecten yessoensis]|uniref:uncharacterized protein LOC110459240 isoform X2 n=1 Tax=Mizuhopecten yessoensis TaxID=6573 RepID=UPI000B459FD3|nr:uncharacterized protein LOC110459240 isoform X2 [Mizuhopecten yessoensis]
MCQTTYIAISERPSQSHPRVKDQGTRLNRPPPKPRYAQDDLTLVTTSCSQYQRRAARDCGACWGRDQERRLHSPSSHRDSSDNNILFCSRSDPTSSLSGNSLTTGCVTFPRNSHRPQPSINNSEVWVQCNNLNETQCCSGSRIKMVRTLGKMLFMCVLISCFVYIVGFKKAKLPPGSGNSEDGDTTSSVRLGGPDRVMLEPNIYKPIALEEFERNILDLRTHYDVIRMFLVNKSISDDAITKLIYNEESSDVVDDVSGSHKRDYDYYNDEWDYNDEDRIVMQKALEHYEEIKTGPLGECSQPRPEIVRVRDFTGDAHKMYIPKFTVIHKCRNVTGCCWFDSQECRPLNVQIVWKPFITFDYNMDEETVEKSTDSVEWVLFENHTHCSCQNLNPLPECSLRCPHPFFMSRPHEECVCDCKKNSIHCNKIKYGMEPLKHKEFECVKRNECMQPACAGGRFDMRKGFCEGVENSQLPILHLLEEERHSPRYPGRR